MSNERMIVVVRVEGGNVVEAYAPFDAARVVVIDHDGEADNPGEATVNVIEPLEQAALVDDGWWDRVLAALAAGAAPEEDDLEEFTVTPSWDTVGGMGSSGTGEPVVFRGRLLAEDSSKHHDATAWEDWRVYQTAGGRIVIVTETHSRWEGACEEVVVRDYANLDAVPSYDVDDPEPEPEAVPIRVICAAQEALGLPVGRRIE